MKTYRQQRGAIAVELAIVLIPLILLTFGVTEFGRAIYQYNGLTKATRDAARFLSEQGPGDPADIATAKCLTVYGNKTCTAPALVPGLTTAMVSICDSTSCADHLNQSTGTGVINLVTITISGYQFVSQVPYVMSSITLRPTHTTMRQVL